MINEQVGIIIRKLRIEREMTQKQLAKILNVTEQAISKWERGLGLPDVSILTRLSNSLMVNLNDLLLGKLVENDDRGNKFKNVLFYVCPVCENVIFSAAEAGISCCGRILTQIIPLEAQNSEMMKVQEVDNEWYITSEHPMLKNNYISFSVYLNDGKIELFSHYPEWSYELRLSLSSRGKLLWYSKNSGFKIQLL